MHGLTSVLGLVKHLTAAEVYWLARAFEGADVEHPEFGMEIFQDQNVRTSGLSGVGGACGVL
ncbi:hypothetical protein ACFQ6B_35510 [Streptomyces wedmorensis]|uniref:Uncharacterized protein n=1 Tax=Streptomyces wedmorensis TaxID=43759 RepID=A0ABW6J188_STRWE